MWREVGVEIRQEVSNSEVKSPALNVVRVPDKIAARATTFHIAVTTTFTTTSAWYHTQKRSRCIVCSFCCWVAFCIRDTILLLLLLLQPCTVSVRPSGPVIPIVGRRPLISNTAGSHLTVFLQGSAGSPSHSNFSPTACLCQLPHVFEVYFTVIAPTRSIYHCNTIAHRRFSTQCPPKVKVLMHKHARLLTV